MVVKRETHEASGCIPIFVQTSIRFYGSHKVILDLLILNPIPFAIFSTEYPIPHNIALLDT